VADFWYTPAKQKLAKGDADFDTLDVRVILCMSDTTADTDQDAATISAITTLDEYDGSGYTEIDLAGVSVNQDDPNNRSEIDYNDGTFGAAVGAGTRNWVGMLYYVFVDGTPANDWPVAWKDLTPANGNGGAVNLTVNAEGLLQVA
jgi:hypothetical protein